MKGKDRVDSHSLLFHVRIKVEQRGKFFTQRMVRTWKEPSEIGVVAGAIMLAKGLFWCYMTQGREGWSNWTYQHQY